MAVAQLKQRRKAAPVTLDGGHNGACIDQCTGKTTGAGTDLENRLAVQVAGDTGDAVEQLGIQQEILTKRLRCRKAVPGDDLPQGRAARVAQASRIRTASAASWMALIIAPGLARFRPASWNAVP